MTFPYNPLIPFQKKGYKDILLLLAECKRGVGKQFGIKTHVAEERKSVIAELLLGTMLMEAPVRLNTLFLSQYDFRANVFPCLFYQLGVIQEQAPDQYVACQPYFVLSCHAKMGLFHHPHGFLLFFFRHFCFEKEESRSQGAGNTYLIVPPVFADQFFGEPVIHGLVNNAGYG